MYAHFCPNGKHEDGLVKIGFVTIPTQPHLGTLIIEEKCPYCNGSGFL